MWHNGFRCFLMQAWNSVVRAVDELENAVAPPQAGLRFAAGEDTLIDWEAPEVE